jgi:outer membrane protein OmpA-like peptidoglycan-associated protein
MVGVALFGICRRVPMKRCRAYLLMPLLAALAVGMTTGCAALLLGMGAGVATATYVMGKLAETYESDYPAAVRASTETLKELKMPVADRVGDDQKTTIRARRFDGTPVEVDITKIGERQTAIGVRTGHVGLWDQQTSRQIQSMIGDRLRPTPGRDHPSGQVELAAAEPKVEPKMEGPAPDAGAEPSKKKVASKAASASTTPSPAAPKANAAGFKPSLTIFFDRGSEEFSSEEIQKLDHIADRLRDHPASLASLHGYSDSLGKASQNFILSVGRADAVKRYLTAKGCREDQLLVVGHGAVKFLGPNDTEAGRRLNRRVEIELYNAP